MSMLNVPVFTYHLRRPVTAGFVAVGRFDGKQPSLAFVTGPDQVVLHTPPRPYHVASSRPGQAAVAGDSASEFRELTVNQAVTALGVGSIVDDGRDALLVGTASNLLAYDVHNNSDVFYKDVPDGVSSVGFGRVPGVDEPVALVGGNCSLVGFDRLGNEQYWTVAGDTVTALCFAEAAAGGRGRPRLLVGTEDFDVRVVEDQEVTAEIGEADVVVHLVALADGRFAFALANGTVGVYERERRVWSRKSKHRVAALVAFDLTRDGTPEVVVGWSDGSVEALGAADGESVYRDVLGAPVAGAAVTDYRNDRKPVLLCVSTDGEIRGYSQASKDAAVDADARVAAAAVEDLRARRLDMQREIEDLRRHYGQAKAAAKGGRGAAAAGSATAVPPDTLVSVVAAPHPKSKSISLTLSTSNDTVIKALAVVCEGLFPHGESLAVFPDGEARSRTTVSLRPERNGALELQIRAVVGYRGSDQNHTFELLHEMPRYASYAMALPREVSEPASHVTLAISERPQRVVLWMAYAFGLDDATRASLSRHEAVNVAFVDVRTGWPVVFTVQPPRDGAGGRIRLSAKTMEVAADMVQDMCSYLRAGDVVSTATFPEELEAFAAVLGRVEEHNAVRRRLAADIADVSGAVRTLVVRAEDARLTGDMAAMRRLYRQLFELNRELAGEYAKRATNQQELLAALRETNQVIQRAAKLRFGKPAAEAVAACRAAIKAQNVKTLLNVVRVGSASGDSLEQLQAAAMD